MKTFLKIIGFICGILIVAKLAQVAIDILYDYYGKKYISANDVE